MWSFMSFLVNFWLGLGNPRHIATKSQHLWAVPRQIRFWSFFKKVGIGSDLPPLGQIPNFYRKFVLKAPLIVLHRYKFVDKLRQKCTDRHLWVPWWLQSKVKDAIYHGSHNHTKLSTTVVIPSGWDMLLRGFVANMCLCLKNIDPEPST